MKNGLLKVVLSEIAVRIASPLENCNRHIQEIDCARKAGAKLCVFTELSLTGYTCADLFLTQGLLSDTLNALDALVKATCSMDMVVVVGAPLAVNGTLYNCAVVLQKGRILGVVPKAYIPDYGEYYETRYFTSGLTLAPHESITLLEQEVPFGCSIVFRCRELPAFSFAVEICEDLWVPLSPSAYHALAGATIICNPSASNDYAGKATRRESLIAAQSDKLKCAYLYSSGASGESSTDLYFSSDKVIATLGASERKNAATFDDILDLQAIAASRLRTSTFHTAVNKDYTYVDFSLQPYVLPVKATSKTPFLPKPERVDRFLGKIFDIQTQGLLQRMRAAHMKALVLGISGGLDSTLALLVCCNAAKRMGLPASCVHAVTMPSFGTTKGSYNNSLALMKALGCTLHEIDIKEVCAAQLSLIGHDGTPDVTYENTQARQRMMLLMNLANTCGGMVVGTSDLSEIAIGFSTFGGDHMSMYNVNCSVPKTLVRELIRRYAASADTALAATLHGVATAPISPELLPVTEDGEQEQKTESIVGNYELIDFLLYHHLKFGFTQEKLTAMLLASFKDDYTEEELASTAKAYFGRFYRSQFKRSCMPDGIKALELSLSPRSDFRLPSDM